MLSPLWKSRNLLFNLVRRDLTVRYRSTVLGFFWSFAKPLAYMGIYHLVFGRILALESGNPKIPYALFVLAGVLPWTFFTGAASEAMHSILASSNLVKKVKLPLEVFPIASVLSHAIHFGLAMLAVVGVMLAFGLVPGPTFLLLPLIAALQVIFILSIALLLSALNVYFRDIVSIWEVVAAAWFYTTPIIYPAARAMDFLRDRFGSWGALIYLANPMTAITLAYRRVTLYGSVADASGGTEIPDGELALALALAALVSGLMLVVSHGVFMRLSRRFADEL